MLLSVRPLPPSRFWANCVSVVCGSRAPQSRVLQSRPPCGSRPGVAHSTFCSLWPQCGLWPLCGLPVSNGPSWKGSQVFRVAALQAGGVGTVPDFVGHWWGSSLSQLGADLGCISEISFSSDQLAPSLLRGFHDAGYTAICHGPSADQCVPSRVGVALAVRRNAVTTWTDVSRDAIGRCLAGNLHLHNGTLLRVIGVYGITGASLPGFERDRSNLQDEGSIVNFIQAQFNKADQQGIPCLVIGDFNSIASVELDSWHGSHIFRQNCLAARLAVSDSADVFRIRHPDLRAFTYFARAGSASRLDSIWLLSPSGSVPLETINAAILVNWYRRVDHAPVLADFLVTLSQEKEHLSPHPPQWKQLAHVINYGSETNVGALRQQVEANLEEYVPLLRQVEQESARLFDAVQPANLFPALHEGLDGIVWAGVEDRRTCALQWEVNKAYEAVHEILPRCLPNPSNSSRSRCQAIHSWEECVHQLRVLRRAFLDATPPTPSAALHSIQPFWIKACKQQSRLLVEQRSASSQQVQWDEFDSSATNWLASVGWRNLIPCAPDAPVAAPTQAPRHTSILSWSVDSPSTQQCLRQISLWQAEAAQRRDLCKSRTVQSRLSHRQHALRSGDIKLWARLMRPPHTPQTGYVPSSITLPNGTVTRPRCKEEVLSGAIQEWSRLFHHPSQPWSSPYVQTWSDASGTARGSPAFSLFPNLNSDSISGHLGRAYFGFGPWVHVLWTKSDIHIWNHAQLAAGSWHVRFDGEIATACRPAPSNTEVWILACVSGRPPLSCSMDWWAHQEQGWLLLRRKEHTAFDPVLPLSQTERESLVRQMRHTRPGPSSFKLLFLSLFPAWLQELFWQLLDIQRLSALVSPSLKKAIQVHMPKPNGGFRALSMLEEAFKALEGPVTKRLVSKRVAHNQPYSHTNLAYVPHFNAAAEVLYVDVLVCEDAALHEQPFCRIPSDYEKFFNTLHLPQIDSVLQARGVPDSARRFYAAAFQGHRLQLETKFGLTPEVAVQRGVMQGGVSSPELSRPAQDPILRLREQSSAVYTTSHGRRVATAGFSDDAEHYGSGVADIPTVVSELGFGGVFTLALGLPGENFQLSLLTGMIAGE